MENNDIREVLKSLGHGIPLNPLPPLPKRDLSVPHAPVRVIQFSQKDEMLAVQNALRYFPKEHHALLGAEFLEELRTYGHIYMYRFRPVNYEMKAYCIDDYPAKTVYGRCVQLMIMNNLDKNVAQFPHELITYGGNGSVLSNWAQYCLVMKYLTEMTETQTLVMYSGHPLGLFPSEKNYPRVVISNGMMIPNYSKRIDYDRGYALGVTQFGQMTAGSYCYIGPQGIVHGTTLVVLNAGRKYLNSNDLHGKVFVTAGLGGMSGAQAKAGTIAGSITVVAEVSEAALNKRHAQGWVMQKTSSLDECIRIIREYREKKEPLSLGYHGNVVDLWERLAEEAEKSERNGQKEILVELGSDQTSCHNPFNGGYYPVQLTFEESNRMMVEDPPKFKELVQESLRRHVKAINTLTSKYGLKFWDYGNSFLLEAGRAKAEVMNDDGTFIYPSYVEDIMGDIFSLGFGPFRWVCSSGDPTDLELTDRTATEIIENLASQADEKNRLQYQDNLLWIKNAGDYKLVVGSQARILYSDAIGRAEIACAFNKLVREGKLKGPVAISRDHHDVSGTDSPFRETANIRDGSMFTADMAVQNFCGLAMRGATWVALHNGGGTGWGEAINGGFGFVLEGEECTEDKVRKLQFWDVMNGVTRRAWSGNENAQWVVQQSEQKESLYSVTKPNSVDDTILKNLFSSK